MKNKKKYEKTNLIAEIEKFGYKVSVKSLLGTFASVVAGCIAAGYLFKLEPMGYVIVCIVAVMCTFSIIYQSYKYGCSWYRSQYSSKRNGLYVIV